MKLRHGALIAIGISAALAAHSSLAQFHWPSIPGLTSSSTSTSSLSSSSSASSSTNGLAAQQDQLVHAYVTADAETVQGQAKLAEALGLKDQAAKLNAEAKALQSGSTVTDDEVKQADTVINDAQPAIDAKLQQSQNLSDESKQTYGQGLLHLAVGVNDTVKLRGPATQFGAEISQKGASPQGWVSGGIFLSHFHKFQAGLYVAKHLPHHLGTVSNGLQNAISFAQNHGIPVPPDATDAARQAALAAAS